MIEQDINKFIPKYYNLKLQILQDIQNGKYPPGSKLPSNSELMQKYGIARGTIERAMIELSNEGFIYTLQGKGCFVSEQNNKQQNNRTANYQNTINNNRKIVFILPYIIDGFYVSVLRGILKFTELKNYGLEIYNSEEKYVKETKLLRKCIEENVAGLIFISSFYEGKYTQLLQLQKRGIPVVLLDTHLKKYNFDYVGSNNIQGAKTATKYLLKMGHRNIAFIGFKKFYITAYERLQGYIQALKEYGIKPNPELIITENKNGKITDEGYDQVKKLLSKRVPFTAIFAINDGLAIGTYKALEEEGIKVPDDVSIIGFDDSNLVRNFKVPLTVIQQDMFNLGYSATKLLFERIEQKNSKYNNEIKKIILDTKLIIRDSVKKLETK
jgi:GntR family transcriptional regulator of arabinose operon